MPTYSYKCSECGVCHEVSHKISEGAPKQCPACKKPGTLEAQIQLTNFVLKGSGWGKDGYK